MLAEGSVVKASVRWSGEDRSLLFRLGPKNGSQHRKASLASIDTCFVTQAIAGWRQCSLSLFGWDSCEDSARSLPTFEDGLQVHLDMSRDCGENFIALVGELEVFEESLIR